MIAIGIGASSAEQRGAGCSKFSSPVVHPPGVALSIASFSLLPGSRGCACAHPQKLTRRREGSLLDEDCRQRLPDNPLPSLMDLQQWRPLAAQPLRASSRSSPVNAFTAVAPFSAPVPAPPSRHAWPLWACASMARGNKPLSAARQPLKARAGAGYASHALRPLLPRRKRHQHAAR